VTREQAATLVQQRFAGAQVRGDAPLVVTVPAEDWLALARFAKETLGCHFFSFSTAVDWKDQGLEVIACVANLAEGVDVMMKTTLPAGTTTCASLVPIYKGADWMERECFDMFGIRFEGHPDLRRILLGDDLEGHPLLKSYAVDTPHPPYR
jgi:NADH-quinone oxidoreductase subunit C